MSPAEDGLDLLRGGDPGGPGEHGRGDLHPLAGLPWLLLPLPQPDALPLPHRLDPAEEHHAGGRHTGQVQGLGQEYPARRPQPESGRNALRDNDGLS